MKRLGLVVTNGPLKDRRFEVKDGGLRLGRSSSNDIHIPDEELSRNHCLFEPVGETGVRVTDLASANGTLVNGTALGNEPAELKVGDLIEVGQTVIAVVGDKPPSAKRGPIDLGLGRKPVAPAARRPTRANVLWIVAVAFVLAAIGVVLTVPRTASDEPAEQRAVEVVRTSVREMRYEKVDATLEGICRYEVTVSADGEIRVILDDTKENRHPTIPPKTLDGRAKEELDAILAFEALDGLDREYAGPEPEPQALTVRDLKVVYTTGVKDVRIVNAAEPGAFRTVREKLEAFVNNELGIHAIRYPREKLVKLAEEQIEIGKAKWEDREVQHGNLFAAVSAFREAIFYLETLDPKPACIGEARSGFEQAKAELDKRTADQRFVVDRAINLGDWEGAQRELTVLLEMLPDRRDDRNREASAKLVDVEKRLKGGK